MIEGGSRGGVRITGEEGDVVIRLLRDDPADYRLLGTWLTDERVLEFYDGRDRPSPLDRVVERYGPRARGESATTSCLLLYVGRPVGYLQYYRVADYPEYAREAGLDDPDAYGVDLFIGQPDLWGRGLGTRAMSLVVRYLFEERGASVVAVDPHVSNLRAIRCYEKAGFRKARILPRHELHEGEYKDSWLMVAERPADAR